VLFLTPPEDRLKSLIVATASNNSIPFRLMAVIFGLAVLYHAAALFIPAFAKAAYPASYPPLRHVAFVIVTKPGGFPVSEAATLVYLAVPGPDRASPSRPRGAALAYLGG
jgi:hypothetical protein